MVAQPIVLSAWRRLRPSETHTPRTDRYRTLAARLSAQSSRRGTPGLKGSVRRSVSTDGTTYPGMERLSASFLTPGRARWGPFAILVGESVPVQPGRQPSQMSCARSDLFDAVQRYPAVLLDRERIFGRLADNTRTQIALPEKNVAPDLVRFRVAV